MTDIASKVDAAVAAVAALLADYDAEHWWNRDTALVADVDGRGDLRVRLELTFSPRDPGRGTEGK